MSPPKEKSAAMRMGDVLRIFGSWPLMARLKYNMFIHVCCIWDSHDVSHQLSQTSLFDFWHESITLLQHVGSLHSRAIQCHATNGTFNCGARGLVLTDGRFNLGTIESLFPGLFFELQVRKGNLQHWGVTWHCHRHGCSLKLSISLCWNRAPVFSTLCYASQAFGENLGELLGSLTLPLRHIVLQPSYDAE